VVTVTITGYGETSVAQVQGFTAEIAEQIAEGGYTVSADLDGDGEVEVFAASAVSTTTAPVPEFEEQPYTDDSLYLYIGIGCGVGVAVLLVVLGLYVHKYHKLQQLHGQKVGPDFDIRDPAEVGKGLDPIRGTIRIDLTSGKVRTRGDSLVSEALSGKGRPSVSMRIAEVNARMQGVKEQNRQREHAAILGARRMDAGITKELSRQASQMSRPESDHFDLTTPGEGIRGAPGTPEGGARQKGKPCLGWILPLRGLEGRTGFPRPSPTSRRPCRLIPIRAPNVRV
jgi:hypothetical protein